MPTIDALDFTGKPCVLCFYGFGYADTYMGGNLYAGQDTLSDFITHIKEFSDCSEFAKTVLKNNQVLSGRNKSEVCYEIATKLHELLNMDTFDDFRNFEKEALLEIVLRSVRGMGDAGVNYMFMMAGDPTCPKMGYAKSSPR